MRRLIYAAILLTACSQAVQYDQPVRLVDQGSDIWVVERGGRVVSTGGEKLIDLDIASIEENHETGLVGLEFWEGGYWLYVAWPPEGPSQLWAMPYHAQSLNDGDLLREWGRAPWHYGGHMEYHPPWLYIGVGDGAAGAQHADHAQDFRPKRGAIFRYHTQKGYWEPAAWGLRNPWTWTLQDGIFYIGDVGAQSAEEVNAAPRASLPNFGWPVYEGADCVQQGCSLDHTPPLIEYRNPDGCSAVVVGGMHNGRLVWSDWCSGAISFTDLNTLTTETIATDLQPTSLLSHGDELWVSSFDGRVELVEEPGVGP